MAEPTDKDTRGPVNLRIKFRSESLQQFIERYGVDVSRGGIFIRTREPLPVGTRLKLDFQLVDTAPLFQGDGTVVWIREHDASRAGVTPGMGVRFDRLTQESQTTLDTILEEKIRLQQSGVAPGSIAKAGAGIAVRRPSGAFATLDAAGRQAGRTAAASRRGRGWMRRAAPADRRRARQPDAGSTSRTGPARDDGLEQHLQPAAHDQRHARGPGSFGAVRGAHRGRHRQGAVRSSRRRAARRRLPIPVAPTVVHRTDAKPIGDDDPTRVFDSSASEEFSQNDAVTGKSEVLPETGVPVAAEGDGELTQRRGRSIRRAAMDKARRVRRGRRRQRLRQEGRRAAARSMRRSRRSSIPARRRRRSRRRRHREAGAPRRGKPRRRASRCGVPMRTRDRPAAATESGRFRSDARYKRQRGKGLYYALRDLVVGGGPSRRLVLYVKRERDKRAAAARRSGRGVTATGAARRRRRRRTRRRHAGRRDDRRGRRGSGSRRTRGPTPAPEKTEPAKPEAASRSPRSPHRRRRPKMAKSGDKPPAQKAEGGSAGEAKRREAGQRAGARPRSRPRPRGEKKPAEAARRSEARRGAGQGRRRRSRAESATPGEGDSRPRRAKPAEAAPSAAADPQDHVDARRAPRSSSTACRSATTPFSSKEVSADATHAITVKKDGYETARADDQRLRLVARQGRRADAEGQREAEATGGEQKPAEAGQGQKKEAARGRDRRRPSREVTGRASRALVPRRRDGRGRRVPPRDARSRCRRGAPTGGTAHRRRPAPATTPAPARRPPRRAASTASTCTRTSGPTASRAPCA